MMLVADFRLGIMSVLLNQRKCLVSKIKSPEFLRGFFLSIVHTHGRMFFYFFCLLKFISNLIPVNYIPECRNIFWTAILIFQVIGMFPYI